jgi:hypothetical protein
MSAKVSKHGQVLATMKIDKLQAAYGNKKKRNALIKKELTKRGVNES